MNAMSKIAILADSIISMDPKDMKKYNVHIVPLSISDDKGKVYKDNGKDIPTPELFRRLNAGDNFKTSATPMGEIVEKVEELLKVNDFVIGVPVATGLSSQYNTFNMVKGEFEGKMFVVKSITGAIAQE
jgi:fatty acid-binding protein DegV